MSRRTRLVALLAGLVLAFTMSTLTSAYHGQVAKFITVTPSHGTLTCGIYYTVKAKVFDKNGNPIANTVVHFSFASSPSGSDKIKWTTTHTDSHGSISAKVKLSCHRGNRTIKAKSGSVSGYAIVHVKIPHH
jgi:cell division protein FtsI/penicillin-binding protein 2